MVASTAAVETDGHRHTRRFLEHCQTRLAGLVDRAAEADDPAGEPMAAADRIGRDDPVARGAERLAAALGELVPRPYQPGWLPVLGPDGSLTVGPSVDVDLAAELVGLAADLPWAPTPRASDGGTALALAPLDRMFDFGAADRGLLTAGIMYVGAGSTYPLHHHRPDELYLTIAGRGRWRWGGHEDHRPVGPGRTLYNHPDDPHTSTADGEPIVALYLLW
ncbi:MAG: dimethylsulfonioproprionate lyase family protein [Actinomycetota bacterium]